MSVLNKKWLLKNSDKNKSIFEKILENRGLTEINEISDFHDPFLFKDMRKAVARIKKAIENEEPIVIFGDYDVDGITAAAILVHALKKMGANAEYRLPNRMEDGYGLSEKFVDEFIEKNIKLIITVDCGISCKDPIAKAKKHGIDTIVTDHHTIPKNPPKDTAAILHPRQKDCKYPFKGLTGAGVALKLAHALIPEHLECFLDLASLGTVADLGPITDENHLIVKRGLDILANTQWKGLKRIKELANIKEGEALDSTKIGFQIAPRINAAGRIGDPYTALHLLLEDECHKKIEQLGNKLEKLNKERQKMTEEALYQAEKMMSEYKKLPYIFIAENPAWHVGILGLVAGKLVEKYARPAIVMQDLGDTLVASARSPEYFNIVEAISRCSDLLISFGGHAQAAGFNLKKENFDKFAKKISKYAEETLKNMDLKATLEIDCELNNDEINFDLIDQIEKLAPFGKENTRPTFIMRGLEPHFIDQVGQNKDHLKFNVKDFRVIAFRMGEFANKLRQHRKIDMVFQIERNHWKHKDYIQLQALDFSLDKE